MSTQATDLNPKISSNTTHRITRDYSDLWFVSGTSIMASPAAYLAIRTFSTGFVTALLVVLVSLAVGLTCWTISTERNRWAAIRAQHTETLTEVFEKRDAFLAAQDGRNSV